MKRKWLVNLIFLYTASNAQANLIRSDLSVECEPSNGEPYQVKVDFYYYGHPQGSGMELNGMIQFGNAPATTLAFKYDDQKIFFESEGADASRFGRIHYVLRSIHPLLRTTQSVPALLKYRKHNWWTGKWEDWSEEEPMTCKKILEKKDE